MNLEKLPRVTSGRRRVGRGGGSGAGKTAGRGSNGQKSRAGHHAMPARFEGGQMPLTQRLPKLRGFRNPLGHEVATVTIAQLETVKGSSPITLERLQEAGLVSRQARLLKVIGSTKPAAKLTVNADRASAGALKAIEQAGGTLNVPAAKPEPARE